MSNGPGQERRKDQRKKVDLPVAILDPEQRTDTRLGAVCDEIAASGMFIRSDLLLEIGEEVRLAFDLPGGAHLSLRGRVIHVARGSGRSGMGILFTQLSDAHRAALDDYLKKLA